MQKDKISVRNNSLDIAKFIASLLVVGVHAGIFEETLPQLAYLINSVFGRMAVPFFACVTGYFLTEHERKNKNAWIKNVKSLMKYYIVFSIIYVIWDGMHHGYEKMTFTVLFITICKRFVIYGMYYHLWFFPCMIAAIVVLHLAMKCKDTRVLWYMSIILYIFGVFTFTWYGLIQGKCGMIDRLMEWFDFTYIRRFITAILPFAVLGNFISNNKGKRTRHVYIALFMAIIINCLEIETATLWGMVNGTTGSFSLVFVIYFLYLALLRNPMNTPFASRIGKVCRNSSIIVYGLHPLILEILKTEISCSGTVLWFITIVILCGFTFVIEKIHSGKEIKKGKNNGIKRTI